MDFAVKQVKSHVGGFGSVILTLREWELDMVGKPQNTENIRHRIEEAEIQKDWGEISSILDDSTESDVGVLRNIIPRLAVHQQWIIRASVMEVIGDFGLRSFLHLVEDGLEDRYPTVRSYALMAYYDLLKEKALPTIEQFLKKADVELRVTALALHYVELGDGQIFETLRRILSRRPCRSAHRYAAINIFDHYCEVKSHKEIIELFENILQVLPANDGLASEIRKKLEK